VRWLDGRRIARVLTIVCVVVATVAVLVQLPLTVRKRDRRARELAGLTYEDRDFAAGNSVIPAHQQLIFEARAWIPSDGTYRVVEGSLPIEGATELTLRFAPTFITSFLMPRRPSAAAPWVICLGCHVDELGAGVRVVWSDGQGGSLLEVPE
jgi:hypothetical protein